MRLSYSWFYYLETAVFILLFLPTNIITVNFQAGAFADSAFPNYLYFMIYRTANLCGKGFLYCGRALNALFSVAAAPFIYLITRRVCARGTAAIIAILTLLGPINTCTAYYMPEPLYFLSFWILTWFVLQLDEPSNFKVMVLGRNTVGVSSLAKPHALFILPALMAYVLYVSRRKEGQWVQQGFVNAGVFVGPAFLAKFLIGYVIAGKGGLTFLALCIRQWRALQLPILSTTSSYLYWQAKVSRAMQ